MKAMNGKGPGDKVAKGLTLKQREKGLAAAKGLAKLDVLQKGLKDSAKKQVVKAAAKAAVNKIKK